MLTKKKRKENRRIKNAPNIWCSKHHFKNSEALFLSIKRTEIIKFDKTILVRRIAQLALLHTVGGSVNWRTTTYRTDNLSVPSKMTNAHTLWPNNRPSYTPVCMERHIYKGSHCSHTEIVTAANNYHVYQNETRQIQSINYSRGRKRIGSTSEKLCPTYS